MFEDKGVRKFILFSVSFGAICFMCAWVLSKSLTQHSFTGVYMLIPLIMCVTIVLHIILVEASKKAPIKFINKFMAFSGIKLFFYFLVILMYIYFIKRDIVLFLCAFLSLYLVYTILEISAILKYLKKN
jgi:hypothetical protein